MLSPSDAHFSVFANVISGKGNELTPAWISNHIIYTVWYEITYPFLNFNGGAVEVWEQIRNSIPHFIRHVIAYPCWD